MFLWRVEEKRALFTISFADLPPIGIFARAPAEQRRFFFDGDSEGKGDWLATIHVDENMNFIKLVFSRFGSNVNVIDGYASIFASRWKETEKMKCVLGHTDDRPSHIVCVTLPITVPASDSNVVVSFWARYETMAHAKHESFPAVFDKDADDISSDYESILQSAMFSDVCFEIGEATVKAHKFILRAKCPYLLEYATPDKTALLVLHFITIGVEFSPSILRNILRFIYAGRLPSDIQERAPHYRDLAKFFKVKKLEEKAIYYAQKQQEAQKVLGFILG